MLTLSLLACLVAPPKEPTDTRVVLLLDDLSVVEAEPTKDGYAVRRGQTLEAIPQSRVRFVGDSKAAVHRHLLGQAATRPAAAVAVGYEPGTLPLFTSRVQPVLTNRCAGCHARPDYPGAFKLARVAEGFADPEAIERNARSAALQVDRQAPAASPLLRFAVTAHGGARVPPLAPGHPAYGPLAQWAALNAPKLPGPPPATAAMRPAVHLPPASAPAADPTDPGPFNRAMHPPR